LPEYRYDLVSVLHGAGRVIQDQELGGRRRLKVIGFRPALARARVAVDSALRG
jgi:hypothetical protein